MTVQTFIHLTKIRLAKILLQFFGYRIHDIVRIVYFWGFRSYLSGRKRVKIFSTNLPNSFPIHLSVCAILKNEGPYLKEWLDFHLLVGVEKFYLYDNESSDNTRSTLQDYICRGIVEYTWFPGEMMQMPAYEDCINRHHKDSKWIAFIDIDEFIVPCSTDTISEQLKGLPSDVAQILLQWVIFGSSGAKHYDARPVIERFVKCGSETSLPKAIVNPRKVWKMEVHEHFVAGRTLTFGTQDARIHHYFCKSAEEYKKKRERGDAFYGSAATKSTHNDERFLLFDQNTLTDLSAKRFLPKLTKTTATHHE